jgi:hypothetical protein
LFRSQVYIALENPIFLTESSSTEAMDLESARP